MRTPPPTVADRIRTTDTGCWEWLGYRNPEGYGRTRIVVDGVRHHLLVHRYVYEQMVGPIPHGHTIDHLCRNRACCNPTHLEAVTHRVNILRGEGVAAVHAAKTHCAHGHPYDETNTHRARTGQRVCRTCNRDRVRRYRAAKAGA